MPREPRPRRLYLLGVAVAVMLVATACGDDDATGTPTTTPAPSETTDEIATDEDAALDEDPEETRSIDWGNLTYDLECGGVTTLPLVDGSYRPDAANSPDGSLEVALVSAEEIPGQPDRYVVHLTCLAGGAGAHLSGDLFAVMDATELDDDLDPVQLLGLTSGARGTHVLNDDGVLVVNDTIYAGDDPLCCPSLFRSRHVIWDAGEPLVIEGSRPDTEPGPLDTAGLDACAARELAIGWPEPGEVELLERALVAAGFTPGPVDGTLDETTVAAVVRFVEFNASNPALRTEPSDPYDSIHTEAHQLGNVRRPVLVALDIACDEVRLLGG